MPAVTRVRPVAAGHGSFNKITGLPAFSTNGEPVGFLAARHALRLGLEYTDQHPYREPKSDGEDRKEQVEAVVRFSLHMHPRDAARVARPHELLMAHKDFLPFPAHAVLRKGILGALGRQGRRVNIREWAGRRKQKPGEEPVFAF